jgi:hypothetical protein
MDNPLYAFKFSNKTLKDKARISVNWNNTSVVSYMLANSSDSKADLFSLHKERTTPSEHPLRMGRPTSPD